MIGRDMDPVTIGEILFSIDDKMTLIVLSMLYYPVGNKMIDGDMETKIAVDMMYVKRLTGIGR